MPRLVAPFVALPLLAAACSLTDGGPPPAAPAAPTAPTAAAPVEAWPSPPTRRDDVVDDYHGTKVADPYRWLEDQDSPEVAAWVATQNASTRALLDAVPERAALRDRLAELWNYARYDVPEHAGDRWFWRKNDGLQNQAVLYVGSDPTADGEVLLDPNSMSADGTVAVTAAVPDHDGRRLAYATSARGSDWREWHVLDVATKATLPDHLQWAKFSGAAWTRDGAGFFYQRYPAPAAGETYQAQNKNPQLCYHKVGDEQQADRVVYERPDQPEWGFNGTVTDDGRFLIIDVSAGTDRRNRVAYVDLQQDGWPVQPLRMELESSWAFVGNDGDTFYFRTDRQAPRGHVVAVPRDQPQEVREVVAEDKDALQEVHRVGGQFVCSYLHDASSRVAVYAADGSLAGAVTLPSIGSVSGFAGKPDDTDFWFPFLSFTSPPTVYRCELASRQPVPCHAPDFRGHTDDLAVERVFPQSPDGTRLCLFLVHKKGLRLDGSSPCYLYGYGGFDIPLTPRFRVPELVFCERGGIYAQAVLRGGGEYGEDWHRAGMLGNKQNVFDDFVACADYLVRNHYTARSRLAIGGGSNGGLLVGAVLTQHPELVGAAVPEVGVLDMLRYHQFTIGWAWASEYGRSDDKDQFDWLYRYSPLHNVRAGAHYPPTLIMTGDHDDRVLPGHSFKFAAALQAAQGGPSPILLRIETDAGHGAGKPVGKLIDEAADRLAFLTWALR